MTRDKALITAALLAVIVLITGASVYAADAATPARRLLRTQLVRLLDYDILQQSFTVNEQSDGVAFIARRGDGMVAVNNGAESRTFGWIAERSITFMPDGRTTAFVAREGGREFVVSGGVPMKRYAAVEPVKPVFSPDGETIAYVATGTAGSMVVTGPAMLDPALDIEPSLALFSGKGGLMYSGNGSVDAAYRFPALSGMMPCEGDEDAWRMFTRGGTWYRYVMNSAALEAALDRTVEESGAYDSVDAGSLVFSPDGSTLSYSAVKAGETYIVVGDGEHGPFGRVERFGFFLGGASWWCLASSGGKSFMVVDGKKQKEYQTIFKDSIVTGPDGRLGYVAVENSRHVAVMDGKEQKPALEVSGVGFLPAEGKPVYASRADSRWTVSLGGKKSGKYDAVGKRFFFSPDGEHVAYAAKKKEGWLVCVDGKEGEPFEMLDVNNLVFSPDGGRIAYKARTGRRQWAVVCGTERSRPTESVIGTVAFSSDGARCGFVGIRGKDQYVEVDGTNTGRFDAIITWDKGRIVFDSPTSFHYLAVDKGAVYLVEEFIE